MRPIAQTPTAPHQYIVRGTDGIQEVFDRLEHGVLAGDCETTGLDWKRDKIGGLGFAAGDTSAFFMKQALPTAARWCADQVKRRRKLIFHGGKYDLHMLREDMGIHVDYPVHDTLVMSRLIDNRGAPATRYPGFTYSHDLDLLAAARVDPHAGQAYEDLLDAIAEATGLRRGRKIMAFWQTAPIRKAGRYGGNDPWYTLRLYDMFIDEIRHWPQPEGYPPLMELYENERWLLLALRDMEERGLAMDTDYLERWWQKRAKRLLKLERKMNRRAMQALELMEMEDINWRSHPQVKKLFWDDLDLPQVKGDSTNKRALLRMDHSLAALLLKHRKLQREVSSGRVMLENVYADGALHCWFNQNVDTGRMSATEGVHQFARDSGIRRGVIPHRGTVLRSADYSQIEMRFAGHFSGEETLIEGFNSGDPNFDTHAALARRMFGLGKRNPTPQQRDRGKTMNFSMLYGAGEDAVTEQLIDKISEKEAIQSCIELGHRPRRSESPFRSLAKLLRDAVRDSYPKMWRFTKNEEEIAKHQGFVVDAFGYHRYLDENESYKAMNSKVQGSAAHQAKKGMVQVYRELQLLTGEVALISQVHDDIIYESDGNPRTDRRVLELLEDHSTYRVPILTDLKGSAKNWQDKEKITLTRRAA